ncbi:MAG: aldehyde dehydrogenase family protein [Actinomycetota bacterium]|nr:aldehyde dehydrogenase family protein [Actinomycetota bacterium]
MALAPGAFEKDRINNLWGGEWQRVGTPHNAVSSIDGSSIIGPSMLDAEEAHVALMACVKEHEVWSKVDLQERKERVARAIAKLRANEEVLALLLVWEIGKPFRQAMTSVDRTIGGVEWYLENIDRMMEGRKPLSGPVSNIASWNYPLSVLAHAMFVQMLAGNAVIAKSPTDGGVAALTLAMAFAREEGLPVTVVSGSGGRLSPVLVRSPEIGCLAFVGGKDTGGQIASELVRVEKRHMLEQEGLNAWGIWDFSQWNLLAGHIKKGYEYGKQRCTAYPRFVVQRSLFDQFLETYIPVVDSLKVGNPLAVANADDPLPDVDFGPVINAAKARELNLKVEEAMAKGGIPLFRGELLDENFVPGQNRDAYFAPVSILNPPSSCALYHSEPFGPVDTVVIVDTPAEMLSAMNVSNGALVSSIACDNVELAKRLAEEVHAYKVGINAPRSRGDRDEPFGGRGASWKGAFVGGQYLVQAVTEGPAGERLYGNFPDYQLYPPA